MTPHSMTAICMVLGIARRTAYYVAHARLGGRYHRQEDTAVVQQIRAVTKRLVEQNLAEREQRLSRLRESLRREEQKLGFDRAQAEAIADMRTSMLVQEGTPALRREMLRHGFREESRREGREGREGRPMGATTRPVER